MQQTDLRGIQCIQACVQVPPYLKKGIWDSHPLPHYCQGDIGLLPCISGPLLDTVVQVSQVVTVLGNTSGVS